MYTSVMDMHYYTSGKSDIKFNTPNGDEEQTVTELYTIYCFYITWQWCTIYAYLVQECFDRILVTVVVLVVHSWKSSCD